MDDALAMRLPAASDTSASTKVIREPPPITLAVHVRGSPTGAALTKLIFISVLAVNAFLPARFVIVEDAMAVSANAATNPP